MERSEYEELEIEVVFFEDEDIITNSDFEDPEGWA